MEKIELAKMIKNIIDINTKHGRYFSYITSSLIILSLITFSIETIPDLSPVYYIYLDNIEFIILIFFSFEYVLRVVLSENKLKFIFSFFGIIDLVAILPFYLSVGLDLLSIRIFRLLRLFRAFKLLKYTSAIEKMVMAFKSIKEELILFMVTSSFLLYISAVGIYFFENEAQPEGFKSIFHSLWWSVTTLTTVGYGDLYPITVGGKIFTTFIVFIGLGIIAVPTGLFATALNNLVKEKPE